MVTAKTLVGFLLPCDVHRVARLVRSGFGLSAVHGVPSTCFLGQSGRGQALGLSSTSLVEVKVHRLASPSLGLRLCLGQSGQQLPVSPLLVPDQSGQGQALGLSSTSLVEVKVHRLASPSRGLRLCFGQLGSRSQGQIVNLTFPCHTRHNIEVQSDTSSMIVHMVRGSVRAQTLPIFPGKVA
jgi:hypothetical protein